MQTTRRHSRTLQQAFGPYTSREVRPMASTASRWERWADVLFAVALGLSLAAGLYTLWVR